MREFLTRLFRWLAGLIGLRDDDKPPSRLISLEYDMANARLNWVLPVPTNRQRPLAHVRIEGRVAGIAEWTEINAVDVPATTLLVQDIAPGEWEFRGIVVDNAGAESAPLGASLSVEFDAPSPLAEFTAAVE